MIISIYRSIYCIESYRKSFWGIDKYRIAGYENRYRIESWQTIRFTALIYTALAGQNRHVNSGEARTSSTWVPNWAFLLKLNVYITGYWPGTGGTDQLHYKVCVCKGYIVSTSNVAYATNLIWPKNTLPFEGVIFEDAFNWSSIAVTT